MASILEGSVKARRETAAAAAWRGWCRRLHWTPIAAALLAALVLGMLAGR